MAAKTPAVRATRLPLIRLRPLLGAAAAPLIVLALGAAAVWQWPDVRQACQTAAACRALMALLPFLPYAIFGVLLLAGGRCHNAGLIIGALILPLAYFGSAGGAQLPAAGPCGARLAAVLQTLLAFNLAFLALLTRSRLLSPRGLAASGLMLLQAAGLAWACLPALRTHGLTRALLQGPAAAAALAQVAPAVGAVKDGCLQLSLAGWPVTLLSLILSLGFLGLRLVRTADGLNAGFGCALVAAWLGTAAGKPAAAVWFAVAGLILGAALLDSTYRLAYNDELTGLPGRRSLNETLMNLGRQYAVAMIDVDHFKRFNDRFGHDTGDDVLRLIAARLARISGGAKVFRYGGEEFAAVFPGKTADGARSHLEAYRRALADTAFGVRRKKGGARRPRVVKVTVSIGVSAPDGCTRDPAAVLKAADQALYRAKKAGRNRVVA
jgi:diguanylate cyclase (GGDEF)-like protein